MGLNKRRIWIWWWGPRW